VNVKGAKIGPILLIDETLDVATPFKYSLEVRRLFPKAILIAKPGETTHASSLEANQCVDDLIVKYLESGETPRRKNGDEPDVLCQPLPEPSPSVSTTSETDQTVPKLVHNQVHGHRHYRRRRF
jgi:hypothetical protein